MACTDGDERPHDAADATVGSTRLYRLGASVLVGAAVGVLMAFALLERARGTPDIGPTAGALEDGFSIIYGGLIGVFVGSCLGSAFARRSGSAGALFLEGFAAGMSSYCILAVASIALWPDLDVVMLAAILAFWAMFPAFLGAGLTTAVRAAISRLRHRSR